MNRSPAFSSVRAFVALLVTLLQVVGALHFALVPHGYSAAFGGFVHVHSRAATQAKPRAPVRVQAEQTLQASTASCLADPCPVADAPQPTLPRIELLAEGVAHFGSVRLLAAQTASVSGSRRMLLGAPKTSPPA